MSDLLKQLGSVLGALFAAACCLGLPVLRRALCAAGLGFLIHDAILIPLLAGFSVLNLWLLWRASARHGSRRPFALGVAGGGLAATGLYLHPIAAATGLGGLVAGSLWDVEIGRRFARCASSG
ncbi:MAG: MerC domain-containing protein [Steroidobacteraceae bacterium]